MTDPNAPRRRLLDRPDRAYPIVGLVLVGVLVVGAVVLAIVLGMAGRNL